MRFNHLNDWLTWQESLNPVEIDLGLDRIARVLARAGLSSSFNCPLITVAGTNGKGSVVAMLEAMAMSAGLKVCSYTSPHLFRYNERIKINAQPVDDEVLCAAFERIDQARGNSQLTYFEFGTLAAIDLFFKQQPDLVILEVGLGGRLDAVNIMEPDVCVLTSVAIDHVDWLGDDRESIGYEKAGIFRHGKPVICGERDVPVSVVRHAEKLHCELIQAGGDYELTINHPETSWDLKSCYADLSGLPKPCLTGKFQYLNAATAILALQALQEKKLLPVRTGMYGSRAMQEQLPILPGMAGSRAMQEQLPNVPSEKTFRAVITKALKQIKLSGRFQQIHTKPLVYVDVAHNLQAAQALASQLKASSVDSAGGQSRTWAIVAMLSDKDIKGVIKSVSAEIDNWCFAGLENTSRGLSVQALIENLPDVFIKATKQENQCKILSDTVLSAESVKQACELVLSKANKDDRIIIFGSFYTVAEAMQYFS
jgi:dihydrofolate synthase/folylpolyglutamate synthase